ncbi:MAG: histidine phosphatase family protein [Betaproteobacteria bacterium]|nr:MAG: histidine phosphatase family protein [Betaproteobacteria bacterium]
MDLILWRHADAEDGIPDGERELTAKGLKQAARMAKWLRPRLPEDAVVLASPAKRAQQTARALTADFKVVEEIGTSASAEEVLRACGWPQAGRTRVVVGHQPTLGEVAAMLLTGTRGQWNLKKGAVIWIAHGAGGGFGRPSLRAAISPDLL